MIQITCTCGLHEDVPESEASKPWLCASCGKRTFLICAETLPEGAGAGDFDATLTIASGPSFSGERMALGGVVSIEIGKLPGKHVNLNGSTVSRNHCHLERIDFGPSRWRIVDDNSRFGTFVNGQRVTQQDLQSGDMITVGEFTLKYDMLQPAQNEPVAQAALASHASATASLPAAKIATKVPSATAFKPAARKTLSYASPARDGEPLPLGECDAAWVMKLRNASMLMIYVLIANSVRRLAFSPMLDSGIAIISAGMSIAAAWLLTTPEPGVKNSAFGVRAFLRLFAIIGGIGEILVSLGQMMREEDAVGIGALTAIGFILAIALIPQTGLFLFYLRRLAKRIPNEGLAFGASMVMIGLPLFMALAGYSVWQLATTRAKSGIGTGLLALLGLFIMRITYIGLLFWFKRSFS